MQVFKGIAAKKEKTKNGIVGRFFAVIKRRLPGGIYYNQLSDSLSSKTPLGKRLYFILFYIAGGSFSTFLFPKMKVEITGEYKNDGVLFHLAPVESLEKIRQTGLVSKRNYIYLTDDVDFFSKDDEYVNWKSAELKKNTEFCVLKIDSSKLRQRHKIYSINKEHEFVTEKVEPEFIIIQ